MRLAAVVSAILFTQTARRAWGSSASISIFGRFGYGAFLEHRQHGRNSSIDNTYSTVSLLMKW
jgi:hypothetical protein